MDAGLSVYGHSADPLPLTGGIGFEYTVVSGTYDKGQKGYEGRYSAD